MRVGFVSDLHGHFPVIEHCDLLIISGDVCPEEDQIFWLNERFCPWLISLEKTVEQVLWIGGNHDYALMDDEFEWLDPPKTTYLNHESFEYRGLKIFGTPFTKKNKTARKFSIDEGELAIKFHDIPDGLDIVIGHGPPYDVLDCSDTGLRAGSSAVHYMLYNRKPRYYACGHMHENYGIKKFHETMVINSAMASVVGKKPIYYPIYLDISPRTTRSG